jgi:RimJ/RimL family protein N-acetyltransferase
MKTIEEGYARLLDVPVNALYQKRIQIIETDSRNKPVWAKWVVPIWIIRFTGAPVCSVSSKYIEIAKKLVEKLDNLDILSPRLLTFAQTIHNGSGRWNQREILVYKNGIPAKRHGHKVEQLMLKDDNSRKLLNFFDGGVFVIRNESGEIVAYAGMKDKGIIQEIAVRTDHAYQRQGMAQDVISQAITTILAEGNIPTYIPDSLDNTASYLLALKLGFDKVGEMIFWEYELQNWPGFVKEPSLTKIKNRLIGKILHASSPHKQ